MNVLPGLINPKLEGLRLELRVRGQEEIRRSEMAWIPAKRYGSPDSTLIS